MTVKILFIFLTYLKICSCWSWRSFANITIDEKEAQRFPWTVLIFSTPRNLEFYGSLIHQRAVLTSAFSEANLIEQKFRVFADCYTEYLETEPKRHHSCSQVQNVQEYSIIKKNNSIYQKNLIILILSQSFNINERINIISLYKNKNDVDFNNCAIVSLRDICHKIDQWCTITAQYFSSVAVRINEKQVDFNFPVTDDLPFVIDDLNQRHEFEMYPGFKLILELVGAPVVCRPTNNNDTWLQVGVSDLKMESLVENEELKINGNMIQIQEQDLKVINKVIQMSACH